MFNASEQAFMQRALALAQRGLYTTDPNPRVGCLLVRAGVVVGEGWHRKAGEPHAEIHALQAAGAQARGATAFVTLEPCCHQGRTGPCVEALIVAGITEVIIAARDPNPLVNGQGIARLQAAGVTVRVGLLSTEAESLNAGFIKRMQSGLPLVRMKLAMSLDGRTALANGQSKWITGEAARADVQHWRARSSAVLTGVGTVLADDPQLNVRAEDIHLLGRQPLRVICDTRLRTPTKARALQGGALIYSGQSGSCGAAEVVQLPAGEQGVDLSTVLRDLGRRGCNEVLVEAGATLSGRLLALNLADELLVYVAPLLLGPQARPLLQLPEIQAMSDRIELELLDARQLDTDMRLHYRIRKRGE